LLDEAKRAIGENAGAPQARLFALLVAHLEAQVECRLAGGNG
jgi:hypothetical protein